MPRPARACKRIPTEEAIRILEDRRALAEVLSENEDDADTPTSEDDDADFTVDGFTSASEDDEGSHSGRDNDGM